MRARVVGLLALWLQLPMSAVAWASPELSATEEDAAAVKAPDAAPAEAPPPPPEKVEPPSLSDDDVADTDDDNDESVRNDRVKEPAPVQVQTGQWVYTHQYGWVWMPYGDRYTYVTEQGTVALTYVFAPGVGWDWVFSPWVLGWGPLPDFGVYGVARFGWHAHPWFHRAPRWRGPRAHVRWDAPYTWTRWHSRRAPRQVRSVVPSVVRKRTSTSMNGNGVRRPHMTPAPESGSGFRGRPHGSGGPRRHGGRP